MTAVAPVGALDASALDDPVRGSLRGRHAHLARRHGRALTFRADVATFCAVPPRPVAGDWADLAVLLGAGELADLFSAEVTPPPDWEPVFALDGLQMVGDAHRLGRLQQAEEAPDVVELGEEDLPAMLDLASRTRPGPFWRGTPELGRYVGVFNHGELVAMAGERLRPPGWTEISAVCTAREARGSGLAGLLVRTVAAGVLARGEQPFLHVAADNVAARTLYERLGFRVRREVTFRGFRTPVS